MDQPTSQADHLKIWQHRLRALEANVNELADLEPGREKLQGIESRAQAALRIQSAAAAAKQEASKELDALIAEGRLVMAFLNAGLRQHYGKDSEKLAEFNLAPFRGRRAKAEPPAPPAPPAPPEKTLVS